MSVAKPRWKTMKNFSTFSKVLIWFLLRAASAAEQEQERPLLLHRWR